jgi:hypothetical protein
MKSARHFRPRSGPLLFRQNTAKFRDKLTDHPAILPGSRSTSADLCGIRPAQPGLLSQCCRDLPIAGLAPSVRREKCFLASLAQLSGNSSGTGSAQGLARVKATGHTRSSRAMGRPGRTVDLDAVHRLRAQGRSWQDIAQGLHVRRRTLPRTWALGHNPCPVPSP